MALFRNTDNVRRTWASLTNTETGRTLELDPGQEADVEVPAGFTDPWLRPVRSPKPAPAPEPAPKAKASDAAAPPAS